MDKKINIPKKGAARKWSTRLKELGQQPPPKDLIDKINRKEEQKKSAKVDMPVKDVEI